MLWSQRSTSTLTGWCPACEVSTREAVCWCCGNPLLYGIYHAPGGGSHHHDPEAQTATISGHPVQLTDNSTSLL